MNDRYFELYVITHSIFGRLIRGVFVLSSLAWLFTALTNNSDIKVPLAVFAAVLINELFLEHLSRIKPRWIVRDPAHDPQESITFPVRAAIGTSKDCEGIVKSLRSKDVEFFKKKIGEGSIGSTKVAKNELLLQAKDLVSWVGGEYITEVDLFASYLLLSEGDTRFLQKNNLTNDDIVNILYWTRKSFKPDVFKSNKISLLGNGVFDDLVNGWNYELKKYTKDLTSEVLSKRFVPSIVGREKEFNELTVILSKEKSASAILIGEAGVGANSLVEYLAYTSFIGNIQPELSHKKVYELLVGKLLSGATTAGDLEQRISDMLADIAHSGNSIVFIQDIESIFGGGGFNFDLSGVLAEYANGGAIKLIGTTSNSSFANFIERKNSASSIFEKILIAEPEPPQIIRIICDKVEEIEYTYGVSVQYSAIKQIAELSPIYFPDRGFPGRAIDLLEDVASGARADKRKILSGADVLTFVQKKTNVILEDPDSAEKEVLVHLEEKLHSRVIGQDVAVTAVSQALRRLRSGFKNDDRPISVFLFLGPTGVGKTETAKALAAEYFRRESSMIRLDMSEYQTQEQLGRLLGEESGSAHMDNTLVDLVAKNPFCLVLLDEFEKAHPQLLNVFLQVFDEGRLTTNLGKTISFKNTIIIATSNAGTEILREKENQGMSWSKEEVIEYILKNNIFHPELLNRFDEVVVFNPLAEKDMAKIAGLILSEALRSLEDREIKVVFSDAVLAKIAKDAYSPEFGARQIRRYIEEKIEGYLSKLILEDKIKKGDRITLSVDESGNWSTDIQDPKST